MLLKQLFVKFAGFALLLQLIGVSICLAEPGSDLFNLYEIALDLAAEKQQDTKDNDMPEDPDPDDYCSFSPGAPQLKKIFICLSGNHNSSLTDLPNVIALPPEIA